MKAELITSGTELLLGEITDTNSRFIAERLPELGIDLYYTTTVGDNYERFTGVLWQAWERSDLVIITGGLGPTLGDITREVIAGLLGEKLTVDPQLKKELTAFFAGRGIEMPENNLRQATLIPSAIALRNTSGTAPGWWVEKDNHIIITLPGPPGEMQTMWQSVVLPRLKARSGAVIMSRTLKTWGLSEAKVDEMVAPYLSSGNPTLALYARADGINLRITAKAETEKEVREILSKREAEIRSILDEFIWGADTDTLDGMIGRLLMEKNLSIAVAETFTGGLLTQFFTGNPDHNKYFRGGIVLPAGNTRPSDKTTIELAEKARKQFNADIGLAIDGQGNSEARVKRNAFIAVTAEGKSSTIATGYPGNSQIMARRTINHALVYLRDFIEGTI